jgi:hypothetical protein
MGDDSTHNNTLTFFFASGIQSRKTFFSAFGDGMIKWFDQFILWQRCFVNRKIRECHLQIKSAPFSLDFHFKSAHLIFLNCAMAGHHGCNWTSDYENP